MPIDGYNDKIAWGADAKHWHGLQAADFPKNSASGCCNTKGFGKVHWLNK
jgi:hypothetical protein